MIDTPDPQQSFDALAGGRIVNIHVWAVREGLRETEPAKLFMGLYQQLGDAGVPVWRAFAGTRTLHPQWAGYSYTWWRDGVVSSRRSFRAATTMSRSSQTASLAICGANQQSRETASPPR